MAKQRKNKPQGIAGNAIDTLLRFIFTHHPDIDGCVGSVTAAGSGLQTVTVDNRDISATILNEFTILQRSRRLGDADAAHAQHVGKELVGDMKRVRVRTILRH